jgi:hypothetical protein
MDAVSDEVARALGAVEALRRRGQPDEAEARCRALAAAHPDSVAVWLVLAQLLERRCRLPEAAAAYEAAIALQPGHALAFTRRALIRFRGHFGFPPAPAARRPGVPRITMSTLGTNGRFGNQLLQYGFLRLYAAEHGLAVETPDWIGRDLFDLDDPLTAGGLPLLRETEVDFVGALNREGPAAFRNVDLWGFCCFPTGRLRRHTDRFRALYPPGRKVAPLAAAALATLRARGATLVAVHLRRGDFGAEPYWIAPTAWYDAWLAAVWPTLDRPVLYVATDDPAAAAGLERYRPLTARDLALDLPGAEPYPDFAVLAGADVVAISNSTFSFVAAMVNAGARAFVRPDRGRAGLCHFDPWDAPVRL